MFAVSQIKWMHFSFVTQDEHDMEASLLDKQLNGVELCLELKNSTALCQLLPTLLK